MTPSLTAALIVITVALSLVSCGNKGDLFLSDLELDLGEETQTLSTDKSNGATVDNLLRQNPDEGDEGDEGDEDDEDEQENKQSN